MEMQLDLENYPIWFKPFWKTLYFKVSLFLILIFLLSGLFFLIYRAYKNRKKLFWQIALQDIKDIENSHTDLKKSYFRLTSVLKFYLSHRYKNNFYIKTDDEVVLEIKKIKDLFLFEEDLKRIFLTAKIIKFSDAKFNQDIISDLGISKSIIESTIDIKEK